VLAGHFQHVGIGHNDTLSNFQIFQFRLNFGPYDVNGLGLAGGVFEGYTIVLHVDFGDLQLDLHLTVGFAARVVAAGGCADFASALDAAWQAFVDIGVEVGSDRAGNLDIDLVAGLSVCRGFWPCRSIAHGPDDLPAPPGRPDAWQHRPRQLWW
jgi:hypothetical protein